MTYQINMLERKESNGMVKTMKFYISFLCIKALSNLFKE